ncbi:MAG: FxsA family protein [Kofleriaceae bacterium]|nr:FxsA family protein [Kofleriaceae bacterium]
MGLLVLVAIVAELASVAIVASHAGWLMALALLALAGLLGTSILAGRGVATLGRASAAMQDGRAVAPVVIDGALVAAAGLLLVIPGFVSDAVALLLLLPPTRALVRGRVVAWLRDRLVVAGGMGMGMGMGDLNDVPGGGVPWGADDMRDGVIDTTATEVGPPDAGDLRDPRPGERDASGPRRELP